MTATIADSLLLVMLDAKLREQLFIELCALDHRVDAVADLRAAERRLEKDLYRLIIVEAGVIAPSDLCGAAPETPIIEVDPAHPAATSAERVRAALAETPPEPAP